LVEGSSGAEWLPCFGAGNSIFFAVKRIEDPIGLLPAKLILGINKVPSLQPNHPGLPTPVFHLLKIGE
jgi:hypothetical protein